MDHVSVDLWATNLEILVPDLQTWMAQIEHRLADAASRSTFGGKRC